MRQLGPWCILGTLGRDLAGTYYSGRRHDGERATLCLLSGDRAAAGGEPLTRLIGQHRGLFHPGLIRFRGMDRDGRDCYLIADAVDDALASLRSGRRPAPGQAGRFGAALAAALSAAHDRDLHHGGLDLDNVLWAPDRPPQILGSGVAALGVADRGALARGDVAALGRLLGALIAGLDADQAGGGSDVDGRLGKLVRRLADPGAAISMREAHAMLAEGEPTQTVGSASGIGEQATARDRAAAPAVGAPPAADPLGGSVGRYRLMSRLGRGGMGEVFLARDPALRRDVAVKRIRPGLEHDRSFQALLRREAQLAAHLSHRAIVQVFDLVTDDTADHVVMEYVSGASLHAVIGGSPPDVSEVLRIAAEIADGLAYAHQHGVIHRDLKLENILIDADRQPKIADFGLAHCIATAGDGTTDAALTGDGLTIGTSRAMSPEQAQGHEVDARSDLFSFGVLLYELVTGTSPFASGDRVQTILRVLHHRPPPARELASGVPPALSDLIDQLLEKAPGRRPDSALVVRDRLRSLGAGLEPYADRPGTAAVPHRRIALARGSGTTDAVVPEATVAPVSVVEPCHTSADPPAIAPGSQVHRLPNLRAMVIAFAASLGVGIIQLLIAWSAGIAVNGRAEGDLPRIFIGYLSSYHWWISYTILVPVIVACVPPTWAAFGDLPSRYARLTRGLVLAIACALGSLGVVSEVARAVWRVPLEACQWNYLHCRPTGDSYSPGLRGLLMVLGYLHELLGLSGLLFTVLGAVTLAWLMRDPGSPGATRRAASVLLNQRLCVGAYLVYLVVLRSSKVGNYLAIIGNEDPTIVGMFSRWGSYFNVIAFGMSWALVVGGAWIIATLASHLLVAHRNVRNTLSDDTYGIGRLVTEAVTIAGRPFLLFVLGAIVLIVLPPPGWPPLVTLAVAIVGGAAWQRR